MSLQKMLDYQKIDSKIYRLEKEYNELNEKKEFNKYQNYYKEQSMLVEVEQKELSKTIEQLNTLIKKSEELNAAKESLEISDFDAFVAEEDFAEYEQKLKQYQHELVAINDAAVEMQKRLADLAVKNRQVLNNLVKSQEIAGKLYGKIQMKKRTMKDLARQELPKLKDLKPQIDPEIFKLYEARRNHHIFPVFMPYNEPNCSACGIDVKAEVTEKFNNNTFVECPHCRRLLYIVEK